MSGIRAVLIGNLEAVGPVAEAAEKAGLRCEVCSQSRGLSARLREGAYEVVLVHEHGFGGNGLEVCKRVRNAVGARAGIVMLLLRNHAELINGAVDAGADDVLIWPADSQELRIRLESVALGCRLRNSLQLSFAAADSDTQRLLRNFDERYNPSG